MIKSSVQKAEKAIIETNIVLTKAIKDLKEYQL